MLCLSILCLKEQIFIMETRSYVISCPHCGILKMVVCPTNSWLDTDHILWSDGYLESEQWKGPAYTQQCLSCGKFFTLPPRYICEIKNKRCDDSGLLSYQKLKRAIIDLADDEIPEARARLEAWWAFNVMSRESDNIPAEEIEFNHFNMLWLLEYHTEHSTRFSHLVFELNRLLGNKSECERMINELTFEKYVSQRQERFSEKGCTSNLSEDSLKELYESVVADLTTSLSKPLVPYKK